MTVPAKAVRTLLLAGLCVLGSVLLINLAQAHGSMQSPVSRVYNCFLEGPENPQSAACQEAVAVGGTQPLYDWNEVNLAQADGRHRELIPDGQLCSAGRDKYRGFDLARADWPAERLSPDTTHRFSYRATAPHRGSFELYVTRDSYDPTQPLRWSDLESSPFSTVTDPPLVDGAYVWEARLPQGKSGRHLIYAIWQRSDSPEAFYACSDVIFDGDGTPPPTSTPAEPPGEGECDAPPWHPDDIYTEGDMVSHNGHQWRAQWWTQGEEPGTTGEWGVWEDLGPCDGSDAPTPTPAPTYTPDDPADPTPTPTPDGDVPTWQPGVRYEVGQLASYDGVIYRCIQAHTSQEGWEPPNVQALWERY